MTSRIAILCLSTALAACSQLTGRDSAGTGSSAGAGATSPSRGDAAFMRDISHANLAEIATGKLAAQKGQSPAVKQFGQHMVDEHTQLESEGSTLAQAKGMKPPSSPDLKHQAAMLKLQAVSGDSFDRDYIQQMVKDHTDTLKLLQDTASQASDAQLRQLAQKAIPHVQEHLQSAQRLAGEIVGRAQ
jgi:putative membrane protein